MDVNRAPLTPISLLRRSVRVFPERTAVVYGARRVSYREFGERISRLANGLAALGIGLASKVALVAPNIPMMLEAHAAVPTLGGVVVPINTRLQPAEVGYILGHARAEAVLIDRASVELLRPVLAGLPALRQVVVVEDAAAGVESGWRPPGALDYETLLARSPAAEPALALRDEEQPIAINYTSGTTGPPKGVVFSHRGAFLNTVCNALQYGLDRASVFLWVVPIYHCNGWCFAWTVPALGAASVCQRRIEPLRMRELIAAERVTHFCGAPVVLQFLANLPDAPAFRFPRTVRAVTGGAAPSPTLLAAMRRMNVDVTHIYGLTETYGPFTVCEPQDEWRGLPEAEWAERMAHQGVDNLLAGEVAVLDGELHPVPADGRTMGEICMRGNLVMERYHEDPAATAEAFAGGWFHSGDLGVLHADGSIELRDRAKDIIVSGGENISSIEVENVLASHPALEEVAVVSSPDRQWGEVPVAFVRVRPGSRLSEAELIAFCRERLAHFKCPKRVFFEPPPRTSTGKVQKYALRERMWQGEPRRIRGH
ncbi:MAG: AMP-binding protein [Candidatus Lambdaproteobacteria bacterium]|nr:AMP-binding protein [Candidatus Lambdaproteobacteria bacterium]